MSTLADETTKVYRRKHDMRHRYLAPLVCDDLVDAQAMEDENYNAGRRSAAFEVAQAGYHELANKILAGLRYVP